MSPQTITWIGDETGFPRLIDQTLLPTRLEYRDCRTAEEMWEAIRSLRVRGAPAIGVAAAMGLVVGVQKSPNDSTMSFSARLRDVSDYLRTSRPTAVNLFWALDRMEARAKKHQAESPGDILKALLQEALAIEAEDREMCLAIGRHGAPLIEHGKGVLTHCNAGALATADHGTALSVFYAAHGQGKRFPVFADETRPLLQGARLTAWELKQRGLDVTLICDNMAGQVMKEGKISLVVVGADRVAANGDAANKIGTYSVAVLARAHGIPFYIAAPSSTFDLAIPDGSHIPIEQRDAREVTHPFGTQSAPDGVAVYNPAFDVTPANLITGIITERGVISPVHEKAIRESIEASGGRQSPDS